MALSKSAKYYRDNPESRKKHQESSSRWNKSEKGKEYKRKKNATEEEKEKRSKRAKARNRFKNIPDGYVVDHIKPLAKGGSNSKSNTRLVKSSTNNKKNKK